MTINFIFSDGTDTHEVLSCMVLTRYIRSVKKKKNITFYCISFFSLHGRWRCKFQF